MKILNDLFGKTKVSDCNPLKSIIVDKLDVTIKKEIAEKFKNCFVNVGPNLASKMSSTDSSSMSYITSFLTTLEGCDLTEKNSKTHLHL